MRKILLTLLFVAAAFSLYGQTGLGTAGQQEYARALTNGGRFGAPRYTTANRPTCSASNLGGTIWNTTTGTEQTCDGSTWNSMASASGGSIGPLTSITVGTTTTAGTATCVIDDTMGGASATDNFLNCTGTFPTGASATLRGVALIFTPNWNSQFADGLYVSMANTAAGQALNSNSIYGTNASILESGNGTQYYTGLGGDANSPSVGVRGEATAASGGTAGGLFLAQGTITSGPGRGVSGAANNNGNNTA